MLDDLSSGRRENLASAIGAGARLFEADITDTAEVGAAFARGPARSSSATSPRRSTSGAPSRIPSTTSGSTSAARSTCWRRRARRGSSASSSPPPAARSTARARAGTCRSTRAPRAGRTPSTDSRSWPPRAICRSTAACTGSRRSRCGRETSTDRARIPTARAAWSRSSPRPCWRAGARACSATASRRATTSTSATSRPPSSRSPRPAVRAPYNVGTGTEVSVNELGRRIAAAAGAEFDPERAPARLGEVQRSAVDPGAPSASSAGARRTSSIAGSSSPSTRSAT